MWYISKQIHNIILRRVHNDNNKITHTANLYLFPFLNNSEYYLYQRKSTHSVCTVLRSNNNNYVRINY